MYIYIYIYTQNDRCISSLQKSDAACWRRGNRKFNRLNYRLNCKFDRKFQPLELSLEFQIFSDVFQWMLVIVRSGVQYFAPSLKTERCGVYIYIYIYIYIHKHMYYNDII